MTSRRGGSSAIVRLCRSARNASRLRVRSGSNLKVDPRGEVMEVAQGARMEEGGLPLRQRVDLDRAHSRVERPVGKLSGQSIESGEQFLSCQPIVAGSSLASAATICRHLRRDAASPVPWTPERSWLAPTGRPDP